MFFGGGMLIFWLLLAAVIVVATGNTERIMAWFRSGGAPANQSHIGRETPQEILRRRYAQGEISREEYLESREVLADEKQT